jgi:hypothetical protein
MDDAKDELKMSWEESEGAMNKRGEIGYVLLGLGVRLLQWQATCSCIDGT